ncbi:MAG TPA: YicC/YloC family endoribonuclease [Gemmatimonadaceae bacterium]|nr:YicC/YloC family endoribonuclease [Gemmatimonadaceae bacterium]
MIRSMTGFGAAAGLVGASRVSVELRTVNHRFFNPSLKLPAELSRWEGEVREALRRAIARGHVTLIARIERDVAGDSVVDERRFADALETLRRLQRDHGLEEPVSVATVLRMPNVITSERSAEMSGTADELVGVVRQAITALTAMRESEGQRLTDVLEERIAVVEQALERIALRAPERIVAERERLRAAVAELTGGVPIDEQRLAQEIALLADRLDVAEEIDRFRSHITAFRDTLRRGGAEPVGKRLAFLLQEMVREANTTGSKARDVGMTHDVVAVKEELERIAEQVENLE